MTHTTLAASLECQNSAGERTPLQSTSCSSGNITGTPVDYARCVIVKLDLSANGLSNQTPGLDLSMLCGLDDLQELDLHDNPGLNESSFTWPDGCMPKLRSLDLAGDGLVGQLPNCGCSSALNLTGNAFEPPSWGQGVRFGNASAGVKDCRTSGICAGLPPQSCAAFGPDYRLRSDDTLQCVYCNPFLKTLTTVLGILLVIIFVTWLVVYIRVVRRNRNMKKWVSTISIFISHLQTVAIVGNLRLQWPPSVEEISSLFSLSLVGQALLRPECFASQGVNLQFIFSICEVSAILLLLASFTAVVYSQVLSKRSTDMTWVVMSVVVSMMFGTSWRLSLELFRLAGSLSDVKWSLSAVLAAMLLVLMLVLLWKLLMHALVNLENEKRQLNKYASEKTLNQGAAAPGARRQKAVNLKRMDTSLRLTARLNWLQPGEPWRAIEPERVQRRLQFISGKYADHAPYWQFIIWARQLALILLTVLTRIVVEADGVTDGAMAEKAAVWVQAVLALVVLIGAWRLHALVVPFEYAVQNNVDNFLYASNVVLVSLGTLYTGLTLVDIDKATVDAIEAAMILTLIGALLLAAAYLAWSGRRGMLQLTQAEATRLSTQAKLGEGNGFVELGRLHGPAQGEMAIVLSTPSGDGAPGRCRVVPASAPPAQVGKHSEKPSDPILHGQFLSTYI